MQDWRALLHAQWKLPGWLLFATDPLEPVEPHTSLQDPSRERSTQRDVFSLLSFELILL